MVPTNSPCNTPTLPIKKKHGTWWMVQDLQIINEAVALLHPTVSNLYVILGEVPHSAKWFTILDLKDGLFCIPQAKESQQLFVFKWEASGEKHQQMTWTVLPRGFRDSPHLFGQALGPGTSQENITIHRWPTNLLSRWEKCPTPCNSGSKRLGREGI